MENQNGKKDNDREITVKESDLRNLFDALVAYDWARDAEWDYLDDYGPNRAAWDYETDKGFGEVLDETAAKKELLNKAFLKVVPDLGLHL